METLHTTSIFAVAEAAKATAESSSGLCGISPIFWIAPLSSLIALAFALYFYRDMKKQNPGTELMQKIASHVRKGAFAYLMQQYKIVGIVFALMALFFAFLAFGLQVQNKWVPVAFLTGGLFSGLAGFLGMKTATYASSRSAWAASQSLDKGLRVAFRSGAVMGLVVVGFALLDISVWFLVLNYFIDGADQARNMMMITTTMLTFGMGASLQALFARVGGGIFTKAADVGADLVGKVEAGIPEDDPRNPATIADNVGDNVGDVAGMGADLYESYCGSILATAALGAAAFMTDPSAQMKAVLAPILIAAVGTILSIIGIYCVRVKEGASSKQLLGALGMGVNVSSVLIVISSFLILYFLKMENYLGIWGSIISGLVVGVAIGKVTEYFTSEAYTPTRRIAEQAKTGPATVIIGGVGTGMYSTAFPVMLIVIGTAASYMFAAKGNIMDINAGLYGIGIAAVGMLSTLGITLATDAYGPIADNAGGNAEMGGLPKDVRKRTDLLDALGNTTAATGKGFAIGSAALTALALLASYIEELRMGLDHAKNSGNKAVEATINALGEMGKTIETASLTDFMTVYQVHLMNPRVLMGMFVGAMMSFLFCGLTMNAVGRAATQMVSEVRRQFREIVGIMDGSAEPDYAKCVEISTKAAQKEMIVPSMLAVIAPIATGLILGVSGVLGLLAGGLASGFVLAIFMANSGGSWDNAKKYIEQGNLGGKGSDAHKAAVIGDTVGDPFKDTSGPSLNILIKLMSMVSIVMAGVTVAYSLF